MSLATADNCPRCKASLIGDPIPEDLRKGGHYGDSTHWRREIGIEYEGGYDGVSEWRCPDCGYREDRFTGKEIVS